MTYQLDLSQRRNSDELSTVKTPPRPQLQRNPRSSPVVPTNRYIQTQGRSEPYAGSAADGTPSPQRLLPRLSFGRDISFNKDELSSLFDHESPGKYARTYTRLRRSSKMSNNQNLRAEVSNLGALGNSLATEWCYLCSDILHTHMATVKTTRCIINPVDHYHCCHQQSSDSCFRQAIEP